MSRLKGTQYSGKTVALAVAILLVIATALALLVHTLFPAHASWIQAAIPVVSVLLVVPLLNALEARFGKSQDRIGSGPEHDDTGAN